MVNLRTAVCPFLFFTVVFWLWHKFHLYSATNILLGETSCFPWT